MTSGPRKPRRRAAATAFRAAGVPTLALKIDRVADFARGVGLVAAALGDSARGVVVSDKGDKTIIVKVDVVKSHPKYRKVIRRTAKFHAHDEANTAGIGDTVRIVETRPLSKTKRWRLAEIVEKAR